MDNPNDLQNLTLDAARYRWLRDNLEEFIHSCFVVSEDAFLTPEQCDVLIDMELDTE